MFDELMNDARSTLEGKRIPLQYRVDVNKAKLLLSALETHIGSGHADVPTSVYTLARWSGVEFKKHNPSAPIASVLSIESAGKERTFDLTVPSGSSFVINGIVCHNTTNMPEDVKASSVSDLCMRAWETGCKGVTIYRIGSRDAVIVKETDQHGQPVEIVETHAPKRPKELPCDIHRASVMGEQYLVLVGLLNGQPYEIFAGLQEHIEVPKKVKSGVLVKNGKNKDGVATYNLRIPIGDDDIVLLKDVVNLFDNPIHGALTRTISLALRHGVPVQYLCEQLRKDKQSTVSSFSTCMARVMSKSYIVDGTKVTIEKTCDSCGSTNLVYQQGCSCCADCGQSKCG